MSEVVLAAGETEDIPKTLISLSATSRALLDFT
jgi:hypothetical protein